MLPTTHGFAWEGLVRSLQGELIAYVGFLLCVGLAFWLARVLIRRTTDSLDSSMSVRDARFWINFVSIVLVVAATFALGWRVITVMAANRTPRADVDRTGVYDQMNALTKGK